PPPPSPQRPARSSSCSSRRLISWSSRHLSGPAVTLGAIGPEKPFSGQSRASVTSAELTAIYLTGVTAEVADAPRLLLIVMFWGLVSLKNDPVYCPLPPVNSAPLQFWPLHSGCPVEVT